MQVTVKTLTGEFVNLKLVAGSEETVEDVKERIVLAEPNPFPDQVLSYNGEPLQDGTKLSACGIKDGGKLEFEAKISEEALGGQLEDLLRSSKSSLSVEELGLLYTLNHGITAGAALQALGKTDLLSTFLQKLSKQFLVEGGQVKLVRPCAEQPAVLQQPVVTKVLGNIPEDVVVQQFAISVSVRIELPAAVREEQLDDLRVQAADTVLSIKRRIADSVAVPFADRDLVFAGKVLDDACRLVDCGVVDASHLSFVARGSEHALVAQLATLLQAKGAASRMDLDNMYCCRHGASATQALQMLGWGEKLNGFLQRQPAFIVQGGCVSLAPNALPAQAVFPYDDNAWFLELDAKLLKDGFSERFSQELGRLADTLSAETFLNVARVEKGGAAATGTAIPGAAGAVIVLVLEGLTFACRESWLPSLAQSVAGSLQERLCGQDNNCKVSAAEGVVHLALDGPLREVQVLFSPAFKSYSEALQKLRGQSASTARTLGAAASVAQKVRFIDRQPVGSKAAMRLLKWWREQKQWSSHKTRPSDDLLELLVAHSVAEHPPRNLKAAVLNSLSVMSRFDEISVTWPLAMRSYRDGDVSKNMLEQRPLLLDPASPFANLASPELFQPSELMAFARLSANSGSLLA